MLELQWEQQPTWLKLTVDSSGCRNSPGPRIGLSHTNQVLYVAETKEKNILKLKKKKKKDFRDLQNLG